MDFSEIIPTPSYKRRVADRFRFHPATSPSIVRLHERVRARHRHLARFLVDRLPPSPEAERALAALQESMMWANAAVALHSRDRDNDPDIYTGETDPEEEPDEEEEEIDFHFPAKRQGPPPEPGDGDYPQRFTLPERTPFPDIVRRERRTPPQVDLPLEIERWVNRLHQQIQRARRDQ